MGVDAGARRTSRTTSRPARLRFLRNKCNALLWKSRNEQPSRTKRIATFPVVTAHLAASGACFERCIAALQHQQPCNLGAQPAPATPKKKKKKKKKKKSSLGLIPLL